MIWWKVLEMIEILIRAHQVRALTVRGRKRLSSNLWEKDLKGEEGKLRGWWKHSRND